jgi:hypothetical protein
MGYITYLSFIVAAANALVTIYYLAIRGIPELMILFPSFTIWTIFMLGVVSPLGVFLGWLHFKRSPAYRSEMDISVESNPYNYKLPPGYWKEALVPLMLELLRLDLKIISKEPLTEAEMNSLKTLQKKLETLIEGGHLGNPKRIL